MKVIGITGPTGAGKTTALRELEALGVEVLDCDRLYYELLREDENLRAAIAARFGDVFGPDGLDRKKLGTAAFGDPKLLAQLSAITYPAVEAEIRRRIARARAQNRPGVAIDAIGLLESGLPADCDALVAVLAPEKCRVARIMAREGISRDYAERRVRAQKEEAYFRANCGYVLENSGDEKEFRQKARALFVRLLETKNELTGGTES